MDDFDYELPEERIAQHPLEPRDSARLLIDRGSVLPPAHRHIADLADELRAGDLLVVNDSRVLPARLRLVRATGGTVEVLLLKPAEGDLWEALVRPARRVRPGERLHSAHPAGDDLVVEMTERVDLTGGWLVRLHAQGDPASALGRHGTVPLPPYIRAALTDPERYQTVYARRPGSVAAPTAGLHFTPELIARLEAKGIGTARLELVVGLDTFRPITVDDPADHVMHGERYTIPEETIEACEQAERVVAVGTTVVRALESAAVAGTREGVTELFIRRSHRWRVVDLLLTNFHVPRSTLLLLVDAFVGDRWRTLYRSALEEGYRFLSFGDAMLLDRHA